MIILILLGVSLIVGLPVCILLYIIKSSEYNKLKMEYDKNINAVNNNINSNMASNNRDQTCNNVTDCNRNYQTTKNVSANNNNINLNNNNTSANNNNINLNNNNVSVSYNNINSNNNNVIENNNIVNYNNVNERKVKEKSDNKINWLFGIGIVLICITYFVLINSTWEIISNTFKCVLVLCASLIFFGASIILQKMIKAPKASMVFWILGLIYVPFALIAIFGMRLLGRYLSFAGPGSAIVLSIISIVSLVLNLVSVKKYKNQSFVWLFNISEFLTVIFATRIIKPSFDLNILTMTIYSFVAVIICNKIKQNSKSEYIYKNYELCKKIIIILLNIIISLIAVNLILIKKIDVSLIQIAYILFISALDYYVSMINKKTNWQSIAIGMTIFLVLSIFKYTFHNIDLGIYIFIVELYMLMLTLMQNNDKMLEKSIYLVDIFSSIIVFGISMLLYSIVSNKILFVIGLAILIYNLIKYMNYTGKNNISYLILFTFILFMMNLMNIFVKVDKMNVYNLVIAISLFIIYVISNIVTNNQIINKLKSANIIMIPIITVIQAITVYVYTRVGLDKINIYYYINQIIYMALLLMMFIISNNYTKDEKYKNRLEKYIPISLYIFLIAALGSFMGVLNTFIIAATVMFFMYTYTEYKYTNFHSVFNITSNIALGLGTFVGVVAFQNYAIWYYILSTIEILYKSIEQKNESLKTIYSIWATFVLNIVIYSILDILTIENPINYSICISTIIISLILFVEKRMNIAYYIILLIYDFISVVSTNQVILGTDIVSRLLPYIIWLALLLLQYKNLTKNEKNVTIGISYFIFRIMIGIIFRYYDINLAITNMIANVLIMYLYTRTIFRKHMKQETIDILEIIGIIIISLIAIIQANSIFIQNILIDTIIAILIIINYIYQRNGQFKSDCIIFIIFVFIQIQTIKIPIVWLFVMLIFGIGFIAFATVNEIKKNKLKENNKQ